jgi:hypothetical protein
MSLIPPFNTLLHRLRAYYRDKEEQWDELSSAIHQLSSSYRLVQTSLTEEWRIVAFDTLMQTLHARKMYKKRQLERLQESIEKLSQYRDTASENVQVEIDVYFSNNMVGLKELKTNVTHSLSPYFKDRKIYTTWSKRIPARPANTALVIVERRTSRIKDGIDEAQIQKIRDVYENIAFLSLSQTKEDATYGLLAHVVYGADSYPVYNITYFHDRLNMAYQYNQMHLEELAHVLRGEDESGE